MMLILFTVICGGIYPLLVTGIAQAVFPRQATGCQGARCFRGCAEKGGFTSCWRSPAWFYGRPTGECACVKPGIGCDDSSL